MYCLGKHYGSLCVVTVSWSRAKQYFLSSSCVFLDKKTLLKLWLNSRDKLKHRINHYPLDSAIDFSNTNVMDSDSSDGKRYPSFDRGSGL